MGSTIYPLNLHEIMHELDIIVLMLEQDNNHRYICDFSQYIDKYYRFNKVDTINIFSNCICCVRHQINKPVIYDKWIELDINNADQEEKNQICNCKCRHYSRWICRTCE